MRRERSIIIEIAGKPEAKGRGRVGRVTRGDKSFITVFTPAHTRKYEAVIRHAAGEAMGDRDPVDVPVEVFVHVYLPYPKASKRKLAEMVAGRIRPDKKPDIDNYIKSALDGINNIVITDDKLVWAIHAYKVYRSKPALRIEVRLPFTPEELGELD